MTASGRASVTPPDPLASPAGTSTTSAGTSMSDVVPGAAGVPEPDREWDAPQTARPGTPVCPFVATDAGWRSAAPTREHRCQSVEPPAALAIEKQRRLCLTDDHPSCATFAAAMAARAGRPGPRDDRWPFARTAPLVLDRARPGLAGVADADQRRWGQIGLVVLMVVAFGAVVVARSGAPGGPTALGPSPAVTSGPAGTLWSIAATDPAGSASPAGSGSAPSPVATSAPSVSLPSASPSPSPIATRTYRVKAGDTLIAIAARYGTTVRAIQELNGITDPRRIRVGQVLRLP